MRATLKLKPGNVRQVLLLAALTLAALLTAGVTRAADAKPNILILLADDMGYRGVGPYGSEINTPAIDKSGNCSSSCPWQPSSRSRGKSRAALPRQGRYGPGAWRPMPFAECRRSGSFSGSQLFEERAS
jgi:hypothetical protein